MRTDRALLALHATGIMLALVAAVAWPLAGQAAIMVPIGGNDMRSVLSWAEREDAVLLALDTGRGRVIVRMSDSTSPLHALAAGIIPVATRAPSCLKGAS